MDSDEVIRRLLAAGWCKARVKGSYRHFRHPDIPGLVTVPHPKKDLKPKTVHSIERQSGLNLK